MTILFSFGIALVAIITLPLLGLFYAGYWLGHVDTINEANYQTNSDQINNISDQRKQLRELRLSTQVYLKRLSRHLENLSTQVIRLNAYGKRMRKMAKLDANEFNFNSVPARGVRYKPQKSNVKNAGFLGELRRLGGWLKDREAKLNALETILLHANIRRNGAPKGKLSHGDSNSSGARRDPFTGSRIFQGRIKSSTPIGTPIYTVAAGVVIASERRRGYGNTVEVSHGNGLVSRYAYNSRLLVKVGDKVRKGQKIALMGSTGRSTGSHVHYEILKNGKPISPHQFMVKKKPKK